ncbi:MULTISPECIES: hypothetical protein [Clostridia]|uniref:hypothetical protein n=1 Tax=Clostridia TaxID=186801 RepID=UPI000E4EE7E0|nr:MULTISPECIES: hypothetical protein [Clostridia]RHV71022.1 hypothetical protein DXB15_03690 [Roseburia sp. OM02-15]
MKIKEEKERFKSLVQQAVLWIIALVIVCIVGVNTYNGNVETLKNEVEKMAKNPKSISNKQVDDYINYLMELLDGEAKIDAIHVDFNQTTNDFSGKTGNEIIKDESISQTIYIKIVSSEGTGWNDLENPEWIAKRKEQEETADEIKARLKENDCHGYYLIQFPGSDTISYSL